MNMTYVRVAFYFLSPIIALVPGITVNQEAMTVLIDLNAAALGIAAAGGVSAIIFGKFGKK
jgi:hypothetical protein